MTRYNVMALSILTLVAGFFLVPEPSAAGVIGEDTRKPIGKYAEAKGKTEAEMRKLYGASGRVMCPFNEGSAFLIHANNIVITARHNLYHEKYMGGYAGNVSISRCGFETSDGKTSKWHAVDVTSFVYPPDAQRSTVDRFDWVIMKLSEPVLDVTPYQLPDEEIQAPVWVTAVTIRQKGFPAEDWNERIVADCSVRKTKTIDGIKASGLYTDCSVGSRASGGALLVEGASGPVAIGVISSSTTRKCRSFDSSSCLTFAIGISKPVIQAIKSLAAQ